VDRHPPGVSASAQQGHDAVAGLDPLDAIPHLCGHPGHLQPRDLLRPPRRHGVVAPALVEVGPVDGRGADVDQDLVGPGLGIGHLPGSEDVRVAGLGDADGSHLFAPPVASS